MKHLQNVDLSSFHTFGLSAIASDLYIIEAVEDIESLRPEIDEAMTIMGSGSNMVFIEDQQSPLVKIDLKGIEVIDQSSQEVTIEVGAGENWHEFVSWTVSKSYYGLENLALIPGTVGASPVQNIGAYGREVDQFIVSVHGYDLKKKQFVNLENDDCQFAYRDSIFKAKLKNQFLICSVRFRLKVGSFEPHIEYYAIRHYFEQKGITTPTQKDVFDAIIAIRSSKLPDPAVLGNAGSFFKNPIVHVNIVNRLKHLYPDIPSFSFRDKLVKVPAAWLIEQCGWKGKKIEHLGVYEKHALVLVNHGGGTTEELKTLITSIQMNVLETFGIALVPEVNLID